MGPSVNLPGLPRIVRDDPASPPWAAHHLSLVLEFPRGHGRDEGDYATVGQVTRTVLAASGAPAPLARRMADAVRVAAHYVVEHTTAGSFRLLVGADSGGFTVAVTDYAVPPASGPPAWLPVSRGDRLELTGVGQGRDPLVDNALAPDGLQLHRTPDGHVRLGCHTPWPPPP
ncbi:hypothetical protein [Streptomyces albiaxialis]